MGAPGRRSPSRGETPLRGGKPRLKPGLWSPNAHDRRIYEPEPQEKGEAPTLPTKIELSPNNKDFLAFRVSFQYSWLGWAMVGRFLTKFRISIYRNKKNFPFSGKMEFRRSILKWKRSIMTSKTENRKL